MVNCTPYFACKVPGVITSTTRQGGRWLPTTQINATSEHLPLLLREDDDGRGLA